MSARFTKVPCTACGHPRGRLNGAHFREKRERAGVSLRELARRLGVTASYLCDMELNRRHFLPQYADAYDELRSR